MRLSSTVVPVTDPDDRRIDVFQGLRDHVLRQKRELPDGDMAGVFISEGDLVVERALRAGYEPLSFLVDTKRSKPFPETLNETIERTSVPVYAAGPAVLTRITGYHLHRGVLACFKRRDLLSVDEVLSKSSTLAVIEGTNNPTNLGLILRCAAALGVDGFLIDPTCCDPLYRRCGRVSMGEAYSLPYARTAPLPEGLDTVHTSGFQTVALTPMTDAEDISRVEFERDAKIALLLGAEGPGLTDQTLMASQRRVKIPMTGHVDSINVGAAAAIGFYALQQARRQ